MLLFQVVVVSIKELDCPMASIYNELKTEYRHVNPMEEDRDNNERKKDPKTYGSVCAGHGDISCCAGKR